MPTQLARLLETGLNVAPAEVEAVLGTHEVPAGILYPARTAVGTTVLAASHWARPYARY